MTEDSKYISVRGILNRSTDQVENKTQVKSKDPNDLFRKKREARERKAKVITPC